MFSAAPHLCIQGNRICRFVSQHILVGAAFCRVFRPAKPGRGTMPRLRCRSRGAITQMRLPCVHQALIDAKKAKGSIICPIFVPAVANVEGCYSEITNKETPMVISRRNHKISLMRLLPRLGLVALLSCSLVLTACAPTSTPTLPPATAIAPKPPTATVAASQLPKATLAQPTAVVAPTNTEAAPQAKLRQAVTLTILHTNDVAGETDPCG